MCVVRSKFVATLSKCWVPIFQQSKLSWKKECAIFFFIKEGRHYEKKVQREKRLQFFFSLTLMKVMFGFDSQIFGNVENHTNKFERNKCRDSRCLDDKMRFNDTNRIFTCVTLFGSLVFSSMVTYFYFTKTKMKKKRDKMW